VGVFKTQKDAVALNLTSTVDQRTNAELLNILAPDQKNVQALSMYNLENADMYYEGSLKTRNGSATISNGIAGDTSSKELIFKIVRPSANGTELWMNIPEKVDGILDYPVSLFIADKDYAMISGVFYTQGWQLTNPADDYVTVRTELFLVNQTGVFTSGSTSVMGNGGILHSISNSGNYNAPPYPAYVNNATPTPSGAVPIAYSENRVLLSNYSTADPYAVPATRTFCTPINQVNWSFGAPVALKSGSVYATRYSYSKGSTGARNIDIRYTLTSEEVQPNNIMLQEFLYSGPPGQYYALRFFGGLGSYKQWIFQEVYGYRKPDFITEDTKTADRVVQLPIKDQGENWFSFSPSETVSAPVGQLFTVPSGELTYVGAYFVPSLVKPQSTPSNWNYNVFCVKKLPEPIVPSLFSTCLRTVLTPMV